MPQYTKVCMRALEVYFPEVHQLALFHHFILIQCIDVFFFTFSFFVCQTWRIASLPVWRHPISCLLLCWATKDCIHHNLFIVFLKRCVIELPCMLDMYGFFFFLSVLEDVLFVGWLQHGIHTSFFYRPPHFFGTATKKCQDFPTPCNLYKCISAGVGSAPPPSAVIGLQWVRCAFLLGKCCRRGSWCEGEKKKKKTSLTKEITKPFPGSLVCC